MKKQITLGLIVVLAVAAGYFEDEFRSFVGGLALSSTLESRKSENASTESKESVEHTDSMGDTSASNQAPVRSGGGIMKAIESLRGAPAEEADARRQEFLRRLDSEQGPSQSGAAVGSAAPLPGNRYPGTERAMPPEGAAPVLDPSGFERLPDVHREVTLPPSMNVVQGDDAADELDAADFEDEEFGEVVDSIDVDDDVYLDDAPIDEYVDDGSEDLPPIDSDLVPYDDGV